MKFRVLIDGDVFGPWHDVAEYYGEAPDDLGQAYDEILNDWQQKIDVEVKRED